MLPLPNTASELSARDANPAESLAVVWRNPVSARENASWRVLQNCGDCETVLKHFVRNLKPRMNTNRHEFVNTIPLYPCSFILNGSRADQRIGVPSLAAQIEQDRFSFRVVTV